MNIFKYSPRKGTKAALIKEQINGNIKEERSHILIKLNNILEGKFMSKFIGKDMNVLYELKSEASDDEYEGYTNNYIKVMAGSSKNIECEFYKTKLMECKDEHIMGEVLD